MSEINIYSIRVLIGVAALGIAKQIGKACGAGIQYEPKNEYLSTPDREILVQTLYMNKFAKFEDKYLVNNFTDIRDNTSSYQTVLKAVHAVSMYHSLLQVEPLAFMAKARHGKKLEKIKSSVTRIKSQLKEPVFDNREIRFLSEESESHIRNIANDGHTLLARVEEEVLVNTITESMGSLAYKVKTNGMSIIASKGPLSIRAKVAEGRMKMDTTSFPGISCQTEICNLEKSLEQRGLILRRLCENSSRLRKDWVRLADPFPVRPNVGQDIRKQKETSEIYLKSAVKGGYEYMGQTAVQRYLQQLNNSLLKEKTV